MANANKRHPGDTEKKVIECIEDFIYKVQNENRSISKHKLFSSLQTFAKKGIADRIVKDETLYRARLIKNNDKLNGDFPFEGFDKAGSKQPPNDKAMAMRANYERIPYLYCSTSAYGALSEIRPYINARISLAEIKVVEELKCFVMELPTKKSCADESAFVEKNITLLVQLSNMFQKPVEYGENEYDYYPTQRIAEFLKNLGYDAIIYKSAFDMDSSNYCIFNYDKCEVISSRVYSTTELTYSFAEILPTNHLSELDIRGKVAKLTSSIYKSICGEELQNNLTAVKKLQRVLKTITGDENWK